MSLLLLYSLGGSSTPSADYVAVTQGRKTERYRGSYSLNVSAGDQAGAGVTYAPRANVQSRATLNYATARSTTIGVFDATTAAAAENFVSQAQSRRQPPIVIPPSWSRLGIYGSETNTYADWAPPPVQNWRAPARYQGSPSSFVPVWDPATNRFADWTPNALLSRQAADYFAPRSQTVSVFEQPLAAGTDWTSVFVSRPVAFYRASVSPSVLAWGRSIITDQLAPLAQSRLVAAYAPPRALVIPAFDQPAVVSSTDWTPGALVSRPSAFYRAPRGLIVPVLLAADVTTSDAWAASTQSRTNVLYRGSYSLVIGAADQDEIIAGGTDWASVYQTRRDLPYLVRVARISRVIFPSDPFGLIPPPTPDPVILPLLPGAVVPIGGGGFGAVMSDAFFKRYQARYDARYKPRYKPTIRKQKP